MTKFKESIFERVLRDNRNYFYFSNQQVLMIFKTASNGLKANDAYHLKDFIVEECRKKMIVMRKRLLGVQDDQTLFFMR